MAQPHPMTPAELCGPGRDPDMPLPQLTIKVHGYKTAYADSGGSGPPLLFIHGLAANATHFIYVAPPFTATHRVLAIDLPACGESEPIAKLSVDNLRRTDEQGHEGEAQCGTHTFCTRVQITIVDFHGRTPFLASLSGAFHPSLIESRWGPGRCAWVS